jgi:hypothetical protein
MAQVIKNADNARDQLRGPTTKKKKGREILDNKSQN